MHDRQDNSLMPEMPEMPDRTHIGVAFGFYPFDWKLKPEWGPLVHSINFGPFALTFIF